MWWDERCTLAGAPAKSADQPASVLPPQESVSEHKNTDIPGHGPVGEERLAGSATTSGRLTATVDLEDEYVRDLVLAGLRRRPEWQVTCISGEGEDICQAARDSLLHWGEYERIDWGRVHEGKQHASSYCVRKGLIRKAHLAHNLKKWAAKHPDGRLAAAVPQTLILEVDHPDYFEEALSDCYEVRDMAPGSQKWIAKPSITNQAIGICIFDRVEALQAAVEAAEDLREWVLQRYIDRPLLIHWRKFHLRAYALCIGSLTAYVFSEVLALFAGVPYTGAPLTDLSAHLTNTCHFAAHGRLQDSTASEEDVVKLLSELPEAIAAEQGTPLAEAQARVQQLNADVQAVIGECFAAVSSELTFFTLPNCFELFGFDLLVDEDWHVWLLEANAEPDMKQTGSRLQPLIAGVIEGTLDLVLGTIAADDRGHTCDVDAACTCSCVGNHSAGCKSHEPGGSVDCRPPCQQPCSCQTRGASRTSEVECLGHWVKVFERAEGGRTGGGSGIRMS